MQGVLNSFDPAKTVYLLSDIPYHSHRKLSNLPKDFESILGHSLVSQNGWRAAGRLTSAWALPLA
jgi:hypothetical protein